MSTLARQRLMPCHPPATGVRDRPVRASPLPTLYIRRFCPACAAAIALLEGNGIGFREADVTSNRVELAELRRRSLQTTTPTLDWHGNILVGFELAAWRALLAEHDRLLVLA